jgi:hypothetical protein
LPLAFFAAPIVEPFLPVRTPVDATTRRAQSISKARLQAIA